MHLLHAQSSPYHHLPCPARVLTPASLPALLQNQLHDVARCKPMTATATTMVKSIWQAYFRPAKAEAEAAEEGEAAKVGDSLAWAAERCQVRVRCVGEFSVVQMSC